MPKKEEKRVGESPLSPKAFAAQGHIRERKEKGEEDHGHGQYGLPRAPDAHHHPARVGSDDIRVLHADDVNGAWCGLISTSTKVGADFATVIADRGCYGHGGRCNKRIKLFKARGMSSQMGRR